jgi:hypothetical protein
LAGWITEPVTQVLPDIYRRLGAGDMANLFLLYLLLMFGLQGGGAVLVH